MTKALSSAIRRHIGGILRRVRISVSTYTYNDVIIKTSPVEAVEDLHAQLERKVGLSSDELA